MEKVAADNAAKQRQLEEQIVKANNIALLESELSQYRVQVESLAQEILMLNSEIEKLDEKKDTTLIATLTTQVKVAQEKKELHETKIHETQTKLKKLKGAPND